MVDVRMKILCQRNAVFLTLLLASVSAAQDSTLKPATDAAAQWLALIDAGQYSQSWQQACRYSSRKCHSPSGRPTSAGYVRGWDVWGRVS
jgi:hypothetical protein